MRTPPIVLELAPEELPVVRLHTEGVGDEVRLAEHLRARRHEILRQIDDALDDAASHLEYRTDRYGWTATEITGRPET